MFLSNPSRIKRVLFIVSIGSVLCLLEDNSYYSIIHLYFFFSVQCGGTATQVRARVLPIQQEIQSPTLSGPEGIERYIQYLSFLYTCIYGKATQSQKPAHVIVHKYINNLSIQNSKWNSIATCKIEDVTQSPKPDQYVNSLD